MGRNPLNTLVAALVGGLVAAVVMVGGVHSQQAQPKNVSQSELYSYSDG